MGFDQRLTVAVYGRATLLSQLPMESMCGVRTTFCPQPQDWVSSMATAVQSPASQRTSLLVPVVQFQIRHSSTSRMGSLSYTSRQQLLGA
jgi:hypothetical protein